MSLVLACLIAGACGGDGKVSGTSTQATGGSGTASSGGGAAGGGEGGNGGAPQAQLGDVEVVIAEIDGVASESPFPVVFANVFAEGHYQPGDVALEIVESGELVPVQVDVLRAHDDGSIRHALISTIVPGIDAQQSLTLRLLHGEGPAAAPFQLGVDPATFDARANLAGPELERSLSDVLTDTTGCSAAGDQTGDSAYWRIDGPIMKQCVVWSRMVDAGGTPSEQLDVSFRVTQFSGWPGAEIDLVVENTRAKLDAAHDPSTFVADVAIDMATLTTDQTAWQFGPFTSWFGTRFRALGWYGNEPPDVEKRHDLERLVEARAVNMINVGAVPLPYDYVETYRPDDARWPEPGDSGVVEKAMHSGGGRDDIGALPTWDKILLGTFNREAMLLVEGVSSNGAASVFGNHYRMTADPAAQAHHPGGPVGIPCGQWVDHDPGKVATPGKQETAHQPRIGTVAYMLTGDLFYLEELTFWTIWNSGSEWPYDECIVQGQTRATAWSGVRAHTDLAWLIPESDPRFDTAQGVLDGMFDILASRSTEQAGLFPNITERNISSGLKQSGRKHYVNAKRSSTWQLGWLGWSLQMAARRGYAKARPLADWYLQLIVDLYTVENDPEQCFEAPDGQSYCFPAEAAFAYDIATRLYDEMVACDMASDANPGTITQGEPSRTFVSWGELYYWTLVNKRHQDYPFPNWCPSDGQQWNPANGLNLDDVANNWHEYGGEAAAAALMEAVLDQNPATRSTALAGKAEEAFQRHLELRLAESPDSWERYVAVPLP